MNKSIKSKRIKRIVIWLIRLARTVTDPYGRIRFPKDITKIEKTAADIFFKIIKKPDTELFYDILTDECYLRHEKIYIFIENQNVKIINSIYKYDITISRPLERYLIRKFSIELNKRRILFKKDVVEKTHHSLEEILNNI
jgi:hypothetical protein